MIVIEYIDEVSAAYPDLTLAQCRLVYDIAWAYVATHSGQEPNLDGIVNFVRSELRG